MITERNRRTRIYFAIFLIAAYTISIPLAAMDRRLNDDIGTAEQADPSSAMSRYGAAVFVWVDARSGAVNLFGHRVTPKGMPAGTGANFRVTPPGWSAFQFNPDVAMDDLGRFVVVWDEKSRGGQDVYARLFAANGTPLTDAFEVVSEPDAGESTGSACVAMDSSGNFTVCWNWMSSHQSDIFIRRYDAAGTALGPAGRINAQLTGYSKKPAIGMNRGGRFVVAWEDNLTGQNDIIAQCFDSNGSMVGGNFEASNMPGQANPAQNPAVDVLEDSKDWQGYFCIAFSCKGPGDRATDIHGYFYRDGRSRTVTISDSTLGAEDWNPDIAAVFIRGYQVVWQSSEGSDIHYRYTGSNGTIFSVSFPERANESAGEQKFPCVSWGNESTLFAWSDDRNGNNDIYALWEGNRSPTFVYAGSGFDGMVPVSWDPAYADDRMVSYKIYRFGIARDSLDRMIEAGSYPQLEDYHFVATVDPDDRAYPNLMLDWIDRNVVQGRVYDYIVEPDIVDDNFNITSTWSFSAPGTGFRILSNWVATPPVMDGYLDPGEWVEAAEIVISNPDAMEPVLLYVMNDSNALYIAADDCNDGILDLMNALSFLVDRDHSGSWDSAAPSDEGAYQIISTATGFTGYYGDYPDGFRWMGIVLSPAGLVGAVSTSSGHVQYEARLDIPAPPGSTIGFAASVSDPGAYYRLGFPYAGMWPPGALWEAAETLGELVLASPEEPVDPVDPIDNLDWPMIGGGAGLDSWASAETVLRPPFAWHADYPMEGLMPWHIVSCNGILFAAAWPFDGEDEIDGRNTIIACLMGEGWEELWRFDIPAPEGFAFCPAVDGSLLVCGACGSNGIWALDPDTGEILWTRAMPGAHPVLDGGRVYLISDSLYCLDAANGNTVWSIPITVDESTSDVPEAPAVDASSVYAATWDTLYAVDKASGNIQWRQPVLHRPLIVVDHENVYAAENYTDDGDPFLNVYSKATGAPVWSMTPDSDRESMYPGNAIAVSDSHVLVTYFTDAVSPEGAVLCCLDKRDGSLVWLRGFDGANAYRPTVANGVVYVSSVRDWTESASTLYGFDEDSGTPLFQDDSEFYFSQAVVAQHVLFTPARGKVEWFFNPVAGHRDREKPGVPVVCELDPNFPNPFNPATRILFRMAAPGIAVLKVYDIHGREVAVLANGRYDAGTHEVVFDASGLASGIYLLRIQAGDFNAAKKMVKLQ
ncbi:PQQ-binding-like beta-propeller repeat protein [bacterium]|nr:PQQ-binding-like beta-propeller repeat protein [bacterium]